MLPCGEEKFNGGSTKCLDCNDHIKCFEDTIKKIPGCNLLAGEPCTIGNCDYSIKRICYKVRTFYEQRKRICPTFGAKNEQLVEKCLMCPEETFSNCELAELQFFNFKLEPSELAGIVEEDLDEVKEEVGTCFRSFAFEKICNQCDFKLRCMRESGLRPNGECIRFPKNFKKEKKIDFHENCSKCPMFNGCMESVTLALEKALKELEAKKMFNRFYTLGEIRNTFTTERRA